MRVHWRPLLLVAVAVSIPVLIGAAVVPIPVARGFVLGAGTAGLAGLLVVWVMQVTGTAPTMMGDLAEQWTASELRPLRRRGWRLVNHVRLRPWDIDHVVVGPGGALAVETKWSARPWVLQPPEERVMQAVRQARGNADDLRRWVGFRRAGAPPVHPVVMLWGSGTGQLQLPPGGLLIDGVVVVPGPAANIWRDSLPEQVVLSPVQVELAWQSLDEQVRVRDEHAPELLPPSVSEVAGTAAATLGAGLLGSLVTVKLIAVFGAMYAVWVLASLVLVVAAQPFRRTVGGRLPALGWQTGVLCMLASIGLTLLLS